VVQRSLVRLSTVYLCHRASGSVRSTPYASCSCGKNVNHDQDPQTELIIVIIDWFISASACRHQCYMCNTASGSGLRPPVGPQCTIRVRLWGYVVQRSLVRMSTVYLCHRACGSVRSTPYASCSCGKNVNHDLDPQTELIIVIIDWFISVSACRHQCYMCNTASIS
jgi:hypothetical protein